VRVDVSFHRQVAFADESRLPALSLKASFALNACKANRRAAPRPPG
jgi:hypothetical protein